MKSTKRKFIQAACTVLCALAIAGCATISANKDAAEKDENAPLFEAGKGRADMTLAILRPRGIDLTPDEDKYLDILQGALNNDFAKFSDIQLFDSKNLETILEQQRLSLSGDYSDDDYISIGELTNSKYILAGTLTRIDNTQFNLDLSLTNMETGVRDASFNQGIKLRQIINSNASRAAAAEILPRLGVAFTDAGTAALKENLSAEETEAQNSLALSYEASRSGNMIDALFYSYAATNAGGNSAAAKKQAEEIFKVMGGTGTAIKQDFEQQRYWKQNLIAFEDFFRNHLPFELVYTPGNVQGNSDYDQGTINFEFTAGLRHKNVGTMQKVLNDILKELRRTKYKKNNWGFNEWPAISAVSTRANPVYTDIFTGYRTFKIRAALINNLEEEVLYKDFELYGQLVIKSGNVIGGISTQEINLVMTVPEEYITDNMYVRVVNIDGIDADISNADAYLRSASVPRMPIRNRTTIAEDQRLIVELPEEAARRQAAEQRSREQRQTAEQRQNTRLREASAKKEERTRQWDLNSLKSRRNIYAALMYNPLLRDDWVNALALEGGLGFGYKNFSIDGRFVYPINSFGEINETNNGIFGIGGALGYSLVTNHFLASLEGGVMYYRNNGDSASAVLPSLEAKIDIVPWNPGIALRLGYRLEFGSAEPGTLGVSLFTENNSIGNDKARMIGYPTAGIVLWF